MSFVTQIQIAIKILKVFHLQDFDVSGTLLDNITIGRNADFRNHIHALYGSTKFKLESLVMNRLRLVRISVRVVWEIAVRKSKAKGTSQDLEFLNDVYFNFH